MLTVHAVPHPSFSMPKVLGIEKSTFPPGEGIGPSRPETDTEILFALYTKNWLILAFALDIPVMVD